MKYFIPLFFVLIAFCSCSDNINDNNKRNEGWCWWVDASTRKGEWIPINVSGNVENGTYTLFFSNGVMCEVGKLKNKINVDTTFTYDIYGKLIKYKTYFQDSSKIFYTNNGRYVNYYSNCKISDISIIKNHKISGMWISYYKNGNLEFIEIYKDSITTNKREYYETGQMKDSGVLINNEQFGIIKFWHPNGKLKSICKWTNGKEDGESLFYYESGKLELKSTWVDGTQTEYQAWDESGKAK